MHLSPVFVDYKKLTFVLDILNSTQFWKCLFGLIQACYPVLWILRIADMMIGRMDKLYYYVRQMDRLLEPAMQNVVKLFSDPMMPCMDLSKIK
jgi:hypothetical protein